MKLIDKDALLAEIERMLHFDNNWIEGDKRWQMHTNGVSSAYYKRIGSKHACESILDFANTLEVKEVDLDFQTFAKEMDAIFVLPSSETENTEENPLKWEYAIAKHFYELGIKARKGE